MKQGSFRQDILLLTVIGLFVFPALAFSSSVPLNELKIPAQIGNIKEVFEPGPSAPAAGRTVIQIQDAHCNYEAQKNLVQILDYLVTERNLKLIMVEGGSGDVSLSFLRAYADKKTREAVADKYLRMGKISGEEYFDIISEHQIELYGIEDEELYDANLDSFLKLEEARDQASQDTERFKAAVDELIPYIYNEQLKAFEQKRRDYEQKAVTLSEYCAYLKETAGNLNVDLASAAHLIAFVDSARMEKEIDFKTAEAQRNIFIKELAKQLDDNNVKELIARTQEFKDQKMTAREYYSYLKAKAEKRIDLARDYPQLAGYIGYINMAKDIDAVSLIAEIDALQDALRDKLFVNNDERHLTKISQALGVLNGFLKLELTPQEYEVFTGDRSVFATGSWVNFLNDNCRRYGISTRVDASPAIDDNMEAFEQFYRLGLAREESFIKNLDKKLDESGEKMVVLITGGFHTPGVTRMLKDRGYSYAVVAPVITQQTDSSLYFSVLRGEREDQDNDNYIDESDE